MSNQYEVMRNDIKAIVTEICVKVSKDGLNTSYNWSFASVCADVAKLAHLPSAILPDDLKSIVRFEFNKLKESILTSDGWIDSTTRFGYALTQGEIQYRRSTVALFDNLPLERKLQGARILLDKAGKSLASAKTNEQSVNARKRIRSIEKELNFLTIELDNQNKLIAEINEAANVSTSPINEPVSVPVSV